MAFDFNPKLFQFKMGQFILEMFSTMFKSHATFNTFHQRYGTFKVDAFSMFGISNTAI